MEAQVALIAAFRSSALLSLVSLIFLLTIPHRFSFETLIIKIKTKKLLKCFTLHAMNLKYMKVSLFEITYKKK